MRKNLAAHHGSGLKTALLFFVIVCFVILISLAVRFFVAFKNSSFDGQHQFVLLVRSDNNKGMLALFQPNSSFSVMVVPLSNINNQNISADLHIGIDGSVRGNIDKIANKSDVKSIIFNSIFHLQQQGSHVTWLDLMRLWFIANTTPVVFMPVDKLPQDNIVGTMGLQLFIDSGIQKDNQTVQIINSTPQPGLGTRMASELTNMGADVIDVRSSPTEVEHSVINYDKISYTVTRLERILQMPAMLTNNPGIADIQIIIGADDAYPKTF